MYFEIHLEFTLQYMAYLQITQMLRSCTVLLWPFHEKLTIDAHTILFAVYPKQKTLVCFDSQSGPRTDTSRRLIMEVIRTLLQLPSTEIWTQYNVNCPQQLGALDWLRYFQINILNCVILSIFTADDCCAFAAMAAWCVVYSLPLYMSHDTVRSFRRHMAYTIMRGTVHFVLPQRVCLLCLLFVHKRKLCLYLDICYYLILQSSYRIHQRSGTLSMAQYNFFTGVELPYNPKSEQLKGNTHL